MLFAGSVNLVVLLKLDNVLTANTLQLEAARTTPLTLFRINYDVMPSLKSLNLSIAVL